MQFHFEKDLTHLQYLSEKLSAPNLTDERRKQITDKITKKIQDLKLDLPKAFTVVNPHKDELFRVLAKIEDHLAADASTKTKELRNTIAKIKVQVDRTPLSLEKTVVPKKEEVGLQLACFFDFDGPDTNGAITLTMLENLNVGLPFVTSQRLLSGAQLSVPTHQTVLRNMLIDKSKDWDIFLQKDSGKGEGLVLFLPKNIHADKTPEDKLKALDFNPESFHPTKLLDVMSQSNKKCSIHSLDALFTKDPKVAKTVFLNGHGTTSSVASLSGEEFNNFRELLDNQKVKGLLIHSCYSGGATTLKSLDKPQDEKNQFDTHFSHGNYPTIVRSIGDFVHSGFHRWYDTSVTNLQPDSMESARNILTQLPTFLENKQTYAAFANLVAKEEKTNQPREKEKPLQNFLAVHLPATPGVPQGFRPIGGQGKENFVLTFQKLKREMIKPEMDLKHAIVPGEREISVKNAHSLQLYPQTIPISINVLEGNPILLSMIPGSAGHHLHSLQIPNGDLGSFFDATENFYSGALLGVNKAFFIDTLTVNGKQYQEVVFGRIDGKTYCIYKQEGRCFQQSGAQVEQISPFTHKLLVHRIVVETTPSNDAIRAATAGQEKQEDFVESLEGPPFNFAIDIKFDLDTLSPKEKGQLVAHFLFNKKYELALKLLKDEKIDPHLRDVTGWKILGKAASLNINPIIEYAIESGTDLNDLDGSTLFQIACRKPNEEIVKKLLAAQNVDAVNKTDPSGWPAVVFALGTPTLLNLLLEKNANLDVVNNGISLISQMIVQGYDGIVADLLKRNVDLNLGDHSPLYYAIKTNQPEFVQALIAKGSDPFKPDNRGAIPILEAVKSGSVDILKEFLAQPHGDLNALRDKEGSHLYLEALRNGNREVLALLEEKGMKPPTILIDKDYPLINQLVAEFNTLGEFALIEKILASPLLRQTATDTLAFKNPGYVVQLIKEGKLEVSKATLESIVLNAPAATIVALLKAMPQLVKDKGKGKETYFDMAAKREDPAGAAVFQVFLEQGADPNTVNDAGDPLISQLIKRSDPDKVAILLKWNPDLLTKGEDIDLPLTLATIYKNPVIAKLLIEKGCDPCASKKGGISPLWKAVMYKRDGVLKEMLAFSSIDLNAKTHRGNSIFLGALEGGVEEIIKLLKVRGFTVPAQPTVEERLLIDQLILKFAEKGEYSLLEELLETPEIRERAVALFVDKNPFFAKLIKENRINLFIELSNLVITGTLADIENSVKANPDLVKVSKLKDFESLLQLTTSREDGEKAAIFRYLVEQGADLQDPGYDDWQNPVIHFLLNGDTETVRFCFEKGLKLTEGQFRIAVYRALQSGNPECIKLLAAQQKISLPDDYPRSFVADGYKKGNPNFIAALVEAGIDLTHIPDFDKKDLEQAMKAKNDQANIQLLKELKVFS